MGIFNAMNVSSSALTAQRLRMDVASSNIENSQSNRDTVDARGEYEPYRRKMVTFQSDQNSFRSFLHRAVHNKEVKTQGVKASRIVEDETPFKLEYQPNHPDANDDGYVRLPNVNPLKEMVDIMSATRSYEANVTSLNATKNILLKALEIGK